MIKETNVFAKKNLMTYYRNKLLINITENSWRNVSLFLLFFFCVLKGKNSRTKEK